MRKLITAIALFISLQTFAQIKAESANTVVTAKDTTHKDSVKTYAIVLTEPEVITLLEYLKTVDEKPTVLAKFNALIMARIQLITPPNKEAKK